MQHGESGAAVPRRISNILGKEVCRSHNQDKPRRKSHEGDFFHYGEAPDMSKVKVTSKTGRRQVNMQPRPSFSKLVD